MAIIKWRETYNTGIEQIDKEHKRLVELIDTMYTAVRDRTESTTRIESALADLLEYTDYHFGNEETLMHDYIYPEVQQHQEQHVILRRQVDDFMKKVDGTDEMNQELYHFLRDWLLTHILESDKQFADFVLKGKR